MTGATLDQVAAYGNSKQGGSFRDWNPHNTFNLVASRHRFRILPLETFTGVVCWVVWVWVRISVVFSIGTYCRYIFPFIHTWLYLYECLVCWAL